jgi:hypothetical protein
MAIHATLDNLPNFLCKFGQANAFGKFGETHELASGEFGCF